VHPLHSIHDPRRETTAIESVPVIRLSVSSISLRSDRYCCSTRLKKTFLEKFSNVSNSSLPAYSLALWTWGTRDFFRAL
jgi:hypothetical protein